MIRISINFNPGNSRLMSNNKTFFIKYQNSTPVAIETHFTLDGSERKRPLLTAVHLMTEFKKVVSPLLDSCSIATLSLYSLSTDSYGLIVESALEPDLELSSLDLGRTSKTPLLVKETLNLKDIKLVQQKLLELNIHNSSNFILHFIFN